MNVNDIQSAVTPQPEVAVPAPAAAIDPEFLKQATEAAEKFEAFFITETLRQMRRSTREMASEDSVFNNRVNEDMQDLADGLLADTMASQRAFGIADVILRQLLPADAAAALNTAPPAVARNK